MDYDVPRQLSMSATDCHNHAMAAASAARAAMWSPSFWSIAEIKAESERMASAWRHVAGGLRFLHGPMTPTGAPRRRRI